jgi:hypothetical protein
MRHGGRAFLKVGAYATLFYPHRDFEIADGHAVAVGDRPACALAERNARIVQEHPVGAGIGNVEAVAVERDLGVGAGDETVRVRQHPVAAPSASDDTAGVVEHMPASIAHQGLLETRDVQH